jgi:hypothetical protein
VRRNKNNIVSGLERPENIMEIDLSLNRSLQELIDSYWEFIDNTEGDDSANWSQKTQEDFSALEGYLMKQDIL